MKTMETISTQNITVNKRHIFNDDNNLHAGDDDSNGNQQAEQQQFPHEYENNANLYENFGKNNYNSMYNIIKPRQSIRNRRPNNYDSLAYEFYKNKENQMNNKMDNNNIKNNHHHDNGIIIKIYMFIIKFMTCIQQFIIHYLHYSHINLRLLIYSILILSLGTLKDVIGLDSADSMFNTSILSKSILDFIHNYFRTSKRSFVNIYFVKLGWLWTFIELIPFILFTRLIIIWRENYSVNNRKNLNVKSKKNYETINPSNSDGNRNSGDEIIEQTSKENDEKICFRAKYFKELISPFIRLTIATIIWYYSVETFVYIGKISGHCQAKDQSLSFLHVKYDECRRNGNKWIHGLDISGHIFLMTFSNLIVIEELKYLFCRFNEYQMFYRYIMFDRERMENFIEPYRFKLSSLTHWMTLILTILMMTIVLIWDFMMIQTMLFYHDLIQKILGFMWAITMWFFLYKIIGNLLIKRLKVDYLEPTN